MINAEYGRPALVRFENHLDENPFNLDRQDFGSPNWSFLTHLHNGHTAPESDGNPHYSMIDGPRQRGLPPGAVCRQPVSELARRWGRPGEAELLLVPRPPHGPHRRQRLQGHGRAVPDLRPRRRHRRRDARLPSARGAENNPDGSFDVDYDIPLAFYDCRLDDGVTTHKDIHDGLGQFPDARNPRTHPEWWGKTFYKHFPNHGFVGDIFTVNGVANPVLEVKRRKYRFRFLDASVARIYEFKLMSSTQGPKSAASLGLTGKELQGQYRIPDGQQCMQFTQIATDGGLIPIPVRARLVRAVAGQAPRVHRRLHDVPGRHADHQGRRDLPDQRDADARRADVAQLVAVLPRPELQGPGPQVRHRRRCPRQQRDPAGAAPAARRAEQLEDAARQPHRSSRSSGAVPAARSSG